MDAPGPWMVRARFASRWPDPYPAPRMSPSARKPSPPLPPDADAARAESRRFLRDFRRRMSEQGLIVRMADPQPDSQPSVVIDVQADELSAAVVRLRGRVG